MEFRCVKIRSIHKNIYIVASYNIIKTYDNIVVVGGFNLYCVLWNINDSLPVPSSTRDNYHGFLNEP